MSRRFPHPQYDDELRLGILDEAERRLADEGPESLGLRPLAASQGTSTTAIYTMFGGKAGLLVAVAERAETRLTEALRATLRHDSVESDMRALCREYRRWALDHPGLYGLVVSTGPGGWRELLLQVVDALVDEGVFRSTDVHETATAIWASLHGIVSLELGVWHDSPTAEMHFVTQVDAILRSWTVAGRASGTAGELPSAWAVGA